MSPTMASTISVANETKATASRYTKDGEKITYEMTVIQQPERARACGSGAKSSADRRPVDPPPIVQLRVLKNGEDATFSYNANFFLFATLENARAIATGRVAPSPTMVPVLTGTPVAGMAYLDRPNPAGYFVFPDLSVRHEGKYRLGFSLYEELKEQKDMDNEQITNLEILSQTANPAHVSHRLEVKSIPFTVFSAKKFPGLAESTSLSRLVAEQGCRVRIRRDVRMRRREPKSAFKDECYDDDMSERKHSQTPDAYGHHSMAPSRSPYDGNDRPRSVSNASIASYVVPQRRPSAEHMGQTYQQPYSQQMVQPPPPPGPPSQGMYPPPMAYSASQQQQYHTPPAPPVQPSQMAYPQPPSSQYPPTVPTQAQMGMPNTNPSYGYNVQQQPATQPPMQQPSFSQSHLPPPPVAYDHAQQHVRNTSAERPATPGSYRRASMPLEQNHQQNHQYQNLGNNWSDTAPTYPSSQAYVPTTQTYAHVNSPSNYQTTSAPQANWNPNSSWDSRRNQTYPGASIPANTMPALQAPVQTNPQAQPLAPLRTTQPSMPPPISAASTSPSSTDASHSPGYSEVNTSSSRSSITAPPAPGFQNHVQTQQAGNKRTYSSTFDTHHIDQPLRYGARPDASGYGYVPPPPAPFTSNSSDDGIDAPEDLSAMSYRRADGTERRRRIPIAA